MRARLSPTAPTQPRVSSMKLKIGIHFKNARVLCLLSNISFSPIASYTSPMPQRTDVTRAPMPTLSLPPLMCNMLTENASWPSTEKTKTILSGQRGMMVQSQSHFHYEHALQNVSHKARQVAPQHRQECRPELCAANCPSIASAFAINSL